MDVQIDDDKSNRELFRKIFLILVHQLENIYKTIAYLNKQTCLLE